MFVLRLITACCVIACTAAGTGTHDIIPKFVQCGGTIQADAGALKYPEPGQVIVPGQVCVWTIHLETTENFRMNLNNLNIADSNNNNCTNEGLRFYSLTNLVASGDQQNYTFCHQGSQETTFFLSNSLVTVVFYTSNSTDLDPDAGFSLKWTGMNYDPRQRTHSSSFSSTSSGVVKFPVIGSYQPNLVATWLISPTEKNPLDITLESMVLEGCANSENTCTCDALILLEVSSSGHLSENRRFCNSSQSPILVEPERSTFLLAFFTDGTNLLQNVADTAGFELFYYPRDLTPPTSEATTTTEETVTTEITTSKPDHPNNCGDTRIGSAGVIVYNSDYARADYASCMWTVRAPDSTKIRFSLSQAEFNNSLGGIYVSGFFKQDRPSYDVIDYDFHNWKVLRGGDTVEMHGSVAVVMLPITPGSQNRFFLQWFGNREDPNLSNSQDFRITENSGIINYRDGSDTYMPQEVTTFVFPFLEKTEQLLELEFRVKENGLAIGCYDQIRIYSYDPRYSYCCLTPHKWICTYDSGSLKWTTSLPGQQAVVVFISNSETQYAGFEIEWNWKVNQTQVDGRRIERQF